VWKIPNIIHNVGDTMESCSRQLRFPTAIGDVDQRESRVFRKPPLENGQLWHCRWCDSKGHMGSGIVPVIVNWLNWKVTNRISLMPRFVAFEFSYDEFIAFDFVADTSPCWLSSEIRTPSSLLPLTSIR
jgi:hypothetical protein